ITKLIKSRILNSLVFMLLSGAAFSQSAAIVGPTINCQGTPLTLTVNITGLTAPYAYLWTNGATTSTVTINANTLIRVTVTGFNAGGVLQSVNSPWRLFLFLPAPNVSITANGDVNLCDGQTVDLTANGGNFFSSYLWSTGATSQTITVSTTGDYTVTISQLLSGCSSSATQHVEVFSLSTDPKFTWNGPLTFCKPGSVTLTADPGFPNYLWSTGETTQSITVTLDGSGGPTLDTVSVYLTLVINSTCSFTSVPVVIRSIREPELMPPFCPNFNMSLSDSIKTGIVLAYNGIKPKYEFEFEETTNPGTLWTVISNTRWLKFSNVIPSLQVGKFYNVRTRGIVDNVPYCYGDPCQIGITGLVTPPNASSRVFVDVEDGERFVVRDGINFNVYPNPSNSSFTADVFTLDENPVNVKVFDLSGREINSYKFESSLSQFEFGDELNAGIYFVEFTQGESLRQVSRLVKAN
ncbi:MAG: T9SS type A sorting domain-containing protein, partial [Bacteroidia bacterium]